MYRVPVEREKAALESSPADPPTEPAESDMADIGALTERPIAAPRNQSLRAVREEIQAVETLDVAPAGRTAQLLEDLDDVKIAPEPERFCEDIELVDASSWYACVLRLREEGRIDEAAFELSLLRSKFPDFEIR